MAQISLIKKKKKKRKTFDSVFKLPAELCHLIKLIIKVKAFATYKSKYQGPFLPVTSVRERLGKEGKEGKEGRKECPQSLNGFLDGFGCVTASPHSP